MKRSILFFICLALFLGVSAVAFAYDTIEVKNGGNIEGVVEFTGASVPKDPILTLSSEQKFCGKSLPAEKYVIKDKKIENVVVYIVDIKAGKAVPSEAVTLTNVKCAFVPHVAVGYKGAKFIQKNDDPILHNIHTYLGQKTLYNISLPEKGSSVSKPLNKAGIVEVTCDAHPWMRGFLYVSDHPYAAVTNAKGEFSLKNIPPGTYAVEAWHEALGKVKVANVKVEAGKTEKIKLDYKK